MDPTPIHVLYMTFKDADEARRIGSVLLHERLVACVNILGSAHSLYWWEGAVQEASETVMLAKTRASLVAAATDRVCELHSYSCPCIVALPVAGGNEAFLRWVATETK